MSEVAGRAVRAASFGAVADDYDRCRPGPPSEAVAWFVPRGARTAADVAAGTGGLTEVLSGLVPEVLAIEPDDRMLSVLGRRLPAVHRVIGRGEALPLRAGWVDVVGVASAWHWLEPDRALPEMARVLRPGGVLGVLWSGPDRSVPWVAEVLGSVRGRPPDQGPHGEGRHRLELPPGGPFSPPECATFVASVDYRVDDLVGLAASYSSVITLPDAERDRALARVADRVRSRPELADHDRVALPLRCTCWRTVRRAID